MAPHLKVEREEFVLRALLALKQYDKVILQGGGSGGDDSKGAGRFIDDWNLMYTHIYIYIYISIFMRMHLPHLYHGLMNKYPVVGE